MPPTFTARDLEDVSIPTRSECIAEASRLLDESAECRATDRFPVAQQLTAEAAVWAQLAQACDE